MKIVKNWLSLRGQLTILFMFDLFVDLILLNIIAVYSYLYL